MGAGEPLAVGALPWSAAAAWYSLGICTVCPATTCAVSGTPFAAASDRVVKLLAAAIDQSVSPGWTVWATDASAAAGANRVASAAKAAPMMGRRKVYPFPRTGRGFVV